MYRFVAFLISILLLSKSANSSPTAGEAATLVIPRSPEVFSSADESAHPMSVGGARLLFYRSGLITLASAGTSSKFTLHVATDSFICCLYAIAHESDLFVAYEVTNEQESYAKVCKLVMPHLRQAWEQNLSGLNIASPLLLGKDLYVGGRDEVGRINTRNGAYLWKISGLVDATDTGFNAIKGISYDGTNIVVTEQPADYHHRPALILTINPATGMHHLSPKESP